MDKETIFKFPDVAPLSCAMDAPIVQCRGVSFSFPSATATAATKAKASAGVGVLANKKMPSKGAGKVARGVVHISAGKSAMKPVRTCKVDSSQPLLEGVTLDLTRKSRVVLVGRNGSGKSTLLRLIAAAAGVGGEDEAGSDGDEQERFEPTQGSIVRNHNARVGLFTQVCVGVSYSAFRDKRAQHINFYGGGFVRRESGGVHHTELLLCGVSFVYVAILRSRRFMPRRKFATHAHKYARKQHHISTVLCLCRFLSTPASCREAPHVRQPFAAHAEDFPRCRRQQRWGATSPAR